MIRNGFLFALGIALFLIVFQIGAAIGETAFRLALEEELRVRRG